MTTIGIDARAAAAEPSGRGRVLRELLRRLPRGDDENRFRLYTREPWDEPLDSRLEWVSIDAADPWWHVRTAIAASRECDVFLSTNSYLTAWFTRVPTAVVVYDLVPFVDPEHARRSAARIERATIRPALRRASTLLCISEATERDLGARFPAARGKTAVLPLAADERFGAHTEEAELERVRGRYEVPPAFVFGVGTIEPRKNLQRLIEAFRRLPAGLAERLLIAGPPGWQSEDALDAGDDVVLLGHVPDADLAALYRLCTVFCYPSLYEGFGLPLLEAMTSGAACITSNVSSLPEVGGDAVVYVEPTDVGAIAAALERLLRSEAERRQLGAKALLRAKRFSWERTADEVVRQLEVAARTRS